MAKLKLTDGIVEGVEPAASDIYLWDTALPRFGLRVTPSGSRFYLVQYRAKAASGAGKTRRISIGQHDGDLWNVTKARAAARKLLAPVDLGGDPYAERAAEREAQQLRDLERQAALAEAERREKEGFATVLDAYVARRLIARKSAREATRLLKHGPAAAWGSRHVGAIRRSDVAALIETIRERSPAVARATYAELRPFFDWCVERELIDVSPCQGLTAPPRPKSRDRVLTDAELCAVWRGAEALGYPFGPVIKLIMLTGQRRSEVGGMRWEELDLDKAQWRIPAERSKNGQAHELDLCPEAIGILKDVPNTGPVLFPARGPRETAEPVVGFPAVKRRLDAVIEEQRKEAATKAGQKLPKPLAPWRIHDLRRTAATGLAGMGFPPHIVERVLNHVSGSQSGLVGVYQRHDYRAERKAASLAWGAHVAAIVAGGAPASNVVSLKAPRSAY